MTAFQVAVVILLAVAVAALVAGVAELRRRRVRPEAPFLTSAGRLLTATLLRILAERLGPKP